jgi:hypothetical protein
MLVVLSMPKFGKSVGNLVFETLTPVLDGVLDAHDSAVFKIVVNVQGGVSSLIGKVDSGLLKPNLSNLRQEELDALETHLQNGAALVQQKLRVATVEELHSESKVPRRYAPVIASLTVNRIRLPGHEQGCPKAGLANAGKD